MLSLDEIKRYYPESLQTHNRFIIREYLQYKILEIIFDSQYAQKLVFMGGTCLRIVHNNKRFSEDLDFDNFNLSNEDFQKITKLVSVGLEKLGYEVEMRNIERGAYHCYLRFPELLFKEGLTPHKEEKILIQLDTEAHHYKYKPELILLNKFDVFTQINTTPKDLLLAQKFYALLNRKRNKGRDFFDIVFLLAQNLLPDYNYLNAKLGIQTAEELKGKVLAKCALLNMEEMASDVRPFLFDAKDEKKILMFEAYIKQVQLS